MQGPTSSPSARQGRAPRTTSRASFSIGWQACAPSTFPYKGGGPAAVDLVAGNVQFSFNTASAQVALWKAGRLRALAVLSSKRQPLFPELPSIAETVPGYGVNNWYGFFVPAKTPRTIIDRLSTEINKILKMPDIITLHNNGGIVPMGTTPEEFAKFISAETDKWAKVIKEAGIKVD